MKRYMCISLSIIFILCCSGCIEKKNSSTSTRNYIVYNMGKLPEDLLMAKEPEVRQLDLIAAVFEGLVKTNEKGEICPGIAETWNVSKDNLTYTFKIRNDAKWSDGTDITAEDFVELLSNILSKKTGSSYAGELNCIFGVPEYRKGKSTFKDVAITALDKSTLQIRLNYPCSYLLNVLSQPEFSLRKDNELLKNWKVKYKEIKYSGPFQIDNIGNKDEIAIAKNVNYWNRNEVKSDMMLITSLNSNEIALANLETSKLDIMVDPPLSEVSRLSDEKKIITSFNNKGAALMFNFDKSRISSNINFRKAIYWSVDREKINNEIFSGFNKPAQSYIPRKVSSTRVNSMCDTEKAKEYLNTSKYNKENIILIYLNSSENKRVCEYIAKSLRKQININIKAVGYNMDEFNDAIKKKEFDMIFDKYCGSYDDDTAYLESWCSNSSFNLCGYKNSEFDLMLGKSKIAREESKRKEVLKNAEELFIQDAVVVPLYFENVIMVKGKEVQGVYITSRGNICLEKARFSSSKAYVSKDPCRTIKLAGIYFSL